LTSYRNHDIMYLEMTGIQRIDEKWFKSSHMVFFDDGPRKPGAKTRKFNVFGLKHILLGHVEWYGAWKKYCFFPLDSMLFDNLCLTQIAEFCVFVTREHKDALPKKQWAQRRMKEKRERTIERLALKKSLTNIKTDVSIGFESIEDERQIEPVP